MAAGLGRIAVIVVNFNGGDLVLRALEAVERQTFAPARVIVVDNASSDGSPDEVERRFPAVEVVRAGRNLGFAAANNLGARRADDCDWIALLNPDAFPEPEWLAALAAAHGRRPEYAVLAARLLRAEEPELLDGAGDALHASGVAWRRFHGEPAASHGLRAEEVFSACGAAAAYRRDAFLAAGGFDERFFCFFEDVDLAFRLRLYGERCLYVPDAVVHHVGSAVTGRSSDFSLFHFSRNLVWTYAKNMPAPLVWLYLPQLLAACLHLLVALALQGRGRAVLRGYLAALRGLPRAVRGRGEVQRRRVAGASAVRAALTRGLRPYLENATRLAPRRA